MESRRSILVHPMMRQTLSVALLLAITATLSAGLAMAQNAETPEISNAKRASVYLMQTYEQAGSQVLSCVGSGTLIDPRGLILTNAHLVEPFGPCRGERIVVALSVRPTGPPVPTYLANVVQIDHGSDLAVVAISSGLDGSSIDPGTLNLPNTTFGDPSGLTIGSTLEFVGYPDTGDTSVTDVTGSISGITAEKIGSRSAWYRTTASLGGAMAGGGAYDSRGHLLGVLTGAAGTDGLTPGPNCLGIQDNNRDGKINERDVCVPVASSVTAIRPINFALPLFEAATAGFRLAKSAGLPEAPLFAAPSIRRMYFSDNVSDQGLPTHITSTLPSGSKSVYLFFDFDNFRPGTPYEIRVTGNGAAISDLSVGPLAWGGDRKGTWYVGNDNFVLADGTYEFTVLLSGQSVAVAKLQVGNSPPRPTFSNIGFVVNSESGTSSTGTLFAAQKTTQIIGQFDYANMLKGQDWTQVWYLDGSEIYRTTNLWDKDFQGQTSVSATNLAGLPLGTYRLDLYIGQELAASGDVTLAGSRGPQGQPLAFSNVRIATDISRDGTPAGQTGQIFPIGINSLFVFWDWDSLPGGLDWTFRWFRDGRLVASSGQPWDSGGAGQNYWISLSSAQPLPEGTYAVEALLRNTPMFSSTITLGSGARAATSQQTASDTVSISGNIKDALTGDPVSGALVIVLNVALESPQFEWNEAQIYSQAISDQAGHFTLSKGLPRANYYTVYVFAAGYTTIVEDNFTVLRSQTSPVEISIQLNQP